MTKPIINILSNQKAYEHFFRENYNPLCRFAYTYLKDIEHSEDIVQNSFVRLWENKDSITIKNSIKSYLYMTVRNACLNEIKHNKVKEVYKQHILTNTSNSSNLEDEIEASELQQKINLAISNMPTQRRTIFKMSRYEGLKYSEIAQKMDLSPKTVANHIGLAIKHLKNELKDYLHIYLIIYLIEGLGSIAF